MEEGWRLKHRAFPSRIHVCMFGLRVSKAEAPRSIAFCADGNLVVTALGMADTLNEVSESKASHAAVSCLVKGGEFAEMARGGGIEGEAFTAHSAGPPSQARGRSGRAPDCDRRGSIHSARCGAG